MKVESLGIIRDFSLTTEDLLRNIKLDELIIIFKSFLILSLLRFLLTQTYLNEKTGIEGFFFKLNRKYDIAKDRKKEKWCESLWYALWHMSSLLVCSIILFGDLDKGNVVNFGKRHFMKPDGLWFMYDDVSKLDGIIWPHIKISELLRNFYLFSVGMWISSLFYSFTEVRRSDTLVLQFHHIITSTLIYVSHISRVHRPGIIIIFLHDIADVLLFSTKTLYYSKRTRDILIQCMYGLFAVSHLISRFIMMAIYIYLPAFGRIKSEFESVQFVFQVFLNTPVFILIYGAVLALLIMNIYWFKLIIEMIAFIKTI